MLLCVFIITVIVEADIAGSDFVAVIIFYNFDFHYITFPIMQN